MTVQGIDVSKWQGKIDWAAVKNDGIKFAMLRCGFGRFAGQKDPTFDNNYAHAKANGVPVGAYHYSYAKTVKEARDEAAFCLSIIKGKQFEYPIVYDMEERTVAALGKEKVSAIAAAFCEVMEEAGYYVAIYANKTWFDNLFTDTIIEKYDTWLAHWVEETDYDKPYGMWQYTSNGYVAGISGRVDMNYAYKDYEGIMHAMGLNGFTKEGLTPTPPAPILIEAGLQLTLDSTPMYTTAYSNKVAASASGTYWLYDGVEINGRYRITSSQAYVNRKPYGKYVTGFINAEDIKEA